MMLNKSEMVGRTGGSILAMLTKKKRSSKETFKKQILYKKIDQLSDDKENVIKYNDLLLIQWTSPRRLVRFKIFKKKLRMIHVNAVIKNLLCSRRR